MNILKEILSFLGISNNPKKISSELDFMINYFLKRDIIFDQIYANELDDLIAKLDLEMGLNNIYGIKLLELKIMLSRLKSDDVNKSISLCEKVEKIYSITGLEETKEYGFFMALMGNIYLDCSNLDYAQKYLYKAKAIIMSFDNVSYHDLCRFQPNIVALHVRKKDYLNAEIECLRIVSVFEAAKNSYDNEYFEIIQMLVINIYFESMNFNKAIEICTNAIEKLSLNSLSNYENILVLKCYIGRALIKKKDYKKAVNSLKSSLDYLEFLCASDEFDILSHYYQREYCYIMGLVAEAYYDGGFYSSAVKTLKALLKEDYFQKYTFKFVANKYRNMLDSANEILRK